MLWAVVIHPGSRNQVYKIWELPCQEIQSRSAINSFLLLQGGRPVWTSLTAQGSELYPFPDTALRLCWRHGHDEAPSHVLRRDRPTACLYRGAELSAPGSRLPEAVLSNLPLQPGYPGSRRQPHGDLHRPGRGQQHRCLFHLVQHRGLVCQRRPGHHHIQLASHGSQPDDCLVQCVGGEESGPKHRVSAG